MVWATEHFSYYLLGAEEFTIRSDHDPLRYLRSVPNPKGRLARWIGLLEQYPYKMCYVPGKDIPHADALSRSVQVAEMHLPVDVSSEELSRKQDEDGVIKRVLELTLVDKKLWKGETQEVQQLLKVSGDLFRDNGVLCVARKKGSGSQIVVPRSLVPLLLTRAHDDAGHLGVDRTLSAVRERYFWGSIFKDVSNWCHSCGACQNRNRPAEMPKAPLQFMPIPSAPWQCIAMDFIGPLVKTAKGNTSILVITDRLSKYAINIALPNQKATTTARALFLEVFCVHSFPGSILSDQGRNFESQLITALCEMTGMEKTRTSSYHPQTNGQTERYNQTMVAMLSKCIESETQDDWDEHLPLVAFSYNTSVHSVTGFRPFDLHFGKAPRVRLSMFATTPSTVKAKAASKWLKEMQQQVKALTKEAGSKARAAQEKQRIQYGQDSRYSPYKKGDLVSCREYAYNKGLKPKLIRERWSGPWKVLKVRGPVNYRIAMGKKRKLVHHNRLKPYVERDQALRQQEPDDRGMAEAEELVEEIPADQARPVILYEQSQEEDRNIPAQREEPGGEQVQVEPAALEPITLCNKF